MSLQQDAQQWLYELLGKFKHFRDLLNSVYKNIKWAHDC
jgi:hypothetical protein